MKRVGPHRSGWRAALGRYVDDLICYVTQSGAGHVTGAFDWMELRRDAGPDGAARSRRDAEPPAKRPDPARPRDRGDRPS